MFKYLKKPFFKQADEFRLWNNIKYLMYSYALCFIFVMFSSLVIIITDKILLSISHQPSLLNLLRKSNNAVNNSFGEFTFIFVVLLIPLIEETIFRLPLDLKKWSIALAISILTFRCTGNFLLHFDMYSMKDLSRLCAAMGVGVIVYFFLSAKILENLKQKHFAYYFYFVALSFGLVHIMNFEPFIPSHIIVYPIYVLPQICMGIFIGSIRMQKGFIWAWLLHATINATSFIFN